jgi:hypothetical protein
MDDTLLMNAGLSTTGVAILLIVYRLLKSIQGKKLVSSCCGRKMEMGVDVQDMTPKHISIPIENPMRLTRQETVGVPVTPELPSVLRG